MREIVPEIVTWAWLSPKFNYDFNGYLVRHASGNVCVDPVEMDEATLAELEREGVAVVVLTNRNHYRAAQRVRERTGAKVLCHREDVGVPERNGVVVDGELVVGGKVGPFEVIDAHGKSPGEVALYWRERRLLVIGDACVGNPPGALGLLPAAVIDDEAELMASLRRIAESVDFEVLLVGDGVSILADGRARLRELVERGRG